MRALVFALALVAAPALAQSTPDAAAVDPALVGTWTLEDVEDAGSLGAMGAEIEAMTCRFEADGRGHVEMTLVQDQDVIQRSREFTFDTEGGQIVTDDDDQPAAYRILDDGRMELRHPMGLTLVFRLTAE